jgi:hypothetical protein
VLQPITCEGAEIRGRTVTTTPQYVPARVTFRHYPKALRARCKSTSTQSSNNNDGVPLALTLEFQGVNEVDLFQVDVGATAQRTHLSTTSWPCAPIPVGSASRDHPVRRRSKRTNGNIKSNILIWLRRGQLGVTCQVHSPNFTGVPDRLAFKLMNYSQFR